MRLYSGKSVGQSGTELSIAVVFSCIIHTLIVFAALFVAMTVVPKVQVPPYYQVKLVGQPADLTPAPQAAQPPAPPAEEPKKEPVPQKLKAIPKARKAASRIGKSASSVKTSLPELSTQTAKPSSEQATPAGPSLGKPKQSDVAPDSGTAGGKAANVAVTTPAQNFPFAWYLLLVREKIGQNWRPPPDATNARARVVFTLNRSGWVGDVNLNADASNGTFGFKQAAIRAIRSSNPFPPLPVEFSKQSLEFSVDLMAEQ